MEIFVISLTNAIERRENVKKQLSKKRINFAFFDGLSAKKGFSEYFSAYDEYQYLLNTGRKATDGEIGCYASHLALWKHCVERDKPILIMEDDFHVKDNFTRALHEIEKLISKYGFIRLQKERRGRKKLVKQSADFSLVYYTKMPHSLMCYAISPTVAAEFIKNSERLTAPVDVMIKKIWSHKQRLYGLLPYSIEDDNLSQISNIPGRVKYPKSSKVKFIRFMTKIKWIVKRILFTYNFKPPVK